MPEIVPNFAIALVLIHSPILGTLGIPKKIFCDVDLTLGDKDFELKQKIYSSGLGGIFPKGIEIGSIYEIQDLTPKEVRIIIDLNADPLTSNYFGVLL